MSLQIWLPLNGDLHNQGLNNLIPTNSNATLDNNGKIGQCYYFNGSSARISFPAITMTYPISVCAWIKGETITASGTEYIISYNTTTGGTAGHNIGFGTYQGKLTIWHGGSTASYATALTNNVWYHITAVVTESSYKLYLNGIEILSGSGTQSNKNSQFITLGARSNSSTGGVGAALYFFKGYMNDVRVYNHALSPKEVEEISRGLILHYQLDKKIEQINKNLLPDTNVSGIAKVKGPYARYYESTSSGTYTKVWETIPDPPVYGIKYGVHYTVTSASGFHGVTWYSSGLVSVTAEPYTISAYVKKISSGNVNIKFQYGKSPYVSTTIVLANDNEWHQYSWTFTPETASGKAAASGTTRIYGAGPSTVGEIIVCGWKLEKGSVATPWCENDGGSYQEANNIIYDCSGFGNNGTIVGTISMANNSPRYKTCLHLDCSDPTTNNSTGLTYIESNLTLTTPMQMSVSWWAKPENSYNSASSTSVQNAAWCTSNSSQPTDYSETAFHHRDGAFDIRLDSASGSKKLSLNYIKNEWHHYCVTYNGQIAILYRDGVEITRTTISSTDAPLKSFSKLFIGFSKAGGVWRKTLGSYSDFRVYTIALTAAAVQEIYQTSLNVASGSPIARELTT